MSAVDHLGRWARYFLGGDKPPLATGGPVSPGTFVVMDPGNRVCTFPPPPPGPGIGHQPSDAQRIAEAIDRLADAIADLRADIERFTEGKDEHHQ